MRTYMVRTLISFAVKGSIPAYLENGNGMTNLPLIPQDFSPVDMPG